MKPDNPVMMHRMCSALSPQQGSYCHDEPPTVASDRWTVQLLPRASYATKHVLLFTNSAPCGRHPRHWDRRGGGGRVCGGRPTHQGRFWEGGLSPPQFTERPLHWAGPSFSLTRGSIGGGASDLGGGSENHGVLVNQTKKWMTNFNPDGEKYWLWFFKFAKIVQKNAPFSAILTIF